jgi:hypothetical protein
MLGSVLLVSWVLVSQLSLTQCFKGACQPLHNAATTPRPMAAFDSQAQCDEMRAALAPRVTALAQPQTTGTRTVHRQLTLTCQPGGTTP